MDEHFAGFIASAVLGHDDLCKLEVKYRVEIFPNKKGCVYKDGWMEGKTVCPWHLSSLVVRDAERVLP